MPTNYPGDPANFPTNIQAPNAGEPGVASAMQTISSQVADRTANLKGRITGTAPATAAESGLKGTGGPTSGKGVEGVGTGSGAGTTGTGGATNGAGVIGQGTGSGAGVAGTGGVVDAPGVIGTGTGTAPGVYGEALGTGHGIEGFAGGSGVGGAGIYGRSEGGPGVQGLGFEAYPGAEFTGGDDGGAGVEATGGLNGHGVVATGGGGTGAHAIDASVSAAGGRALNAQTGSDVELVLAENSGAGDGIRGQADNGYGVVAEGALVSPVRAAFRIVPQTNAPSSPQYGDLWFDETNKVLKVYAGSGSPAWYEVAFV